MIQGLNWLRRFKSYYGLSGAENKLRKWLRDFAFVDLRTADSRIDWNKAPVIEL